MLADADKRHIKDRRKQKKTKTKPSLNPWAHMKLQIYSSDCMALPGTLTEEAVKLAEWGPVGKNDDSQIGQLQQHKHQQEQN